ncbi:MgtC/SapB family protein [Puteibacter caeruleilacunae]|nr:MgtC/SapB family protein [Puteibacter caeruleilacunae]
MGWLNDILNETHISLETSIIRLILSFVVGLLIGIERETHRQPAGLRTHILICIGATLLMLLSIYIPQTFQSFQNGDPGRIAAQVVSGIGFLGAGAILKFGGSIRGLTTAASIWAIAAIGLAIGAGMYVIAIVATAIVLFILVFLDYFEKKIFRPRYYKKLILFVKREHSNPNLYATVLNQHGVRITTTDIRNSSTEMYAELSFLVHISERTDYNKLIQDLMNTGFVNTVDIKQVESA